MDMVFEKVEFYTEGLNLTVRKGTKWAGLQFGEKVNIKKGGHEGICGVMMCRGTKIKRFSDITESELSCEHDKGCRTQEGLYKVLCRAYPGFDRDEIVTLVYFELIEWRCQRGDVEWCQTDFHRMEGK